MPRIESVSYTHLDVYKGPAFAIVTAGYYSKILLIQIICSVFACLFAVLFNRKLLISMLKAIKVKRGK